MTDSHSHDSSQKEPLAASPEMGKASRVGLSSPVRVAGGSFGAAVVVEVAVGQQQVAPAPSDLENLILEGEKGAA